MIRLFSFLTKKNLDERIAIKYLEIYEQIEKINENGKFDIFYRRFIDLMNHKEIRPTKGTYSIIRMYKVLNEISRYYKDFYYSIERKNIKPTEYSNRTLKADKMSLMREQNELISLLKEINKEINKLVSMKKIDKFSLEDAELKLIEFLQKDEYFRGFLRSQKELAHEVIEKIYQEAIRNSHEHLWLVPSKDGEKLYFSKNFKIGELKIIENLPLLNDPEINNRKTIINELHKDKTLNFYHYNVLYKGINIHVIPSQIYKQKNVENFVKKVA